MKKYTLIMSEDMQSPWKHGQNFQPYIMIKKGMAVELVGLTNNLRNLPGLFFKIVIVHKTVLENNTFPVTS